MQPISIFALYHIKKKKCNVVFTCITKSNLRLSYIYIETSSSAVFTYETNSMFRQSFIENGFHYCIHLCNQYHFSPKIYTLEKHCTRKAQSSCGGCNRRVHRIVYLAVKKGNILAILFTSENIHRELLSLMNFSLSIC